MKDAVNARKNAITAEEKRLASAKSRLCKSHRFHILFLPFEGLTKWSLSARIQKELVELRNRPSLEQKKVEMRKRLLHLSKKRIQHAKEFTVCQVHGVQAGFLFHIRSQDLVHSIVAEQTQCTIIGLQYLQIGANRVALQELCKRKDDKYENALVEYNESCVVSKTLSS